MAQPLSIEDKDSFFLITKRTKGSVLWFINNPVLEDRILAYLAKYSTTYGVVVGAFALMGNHYHLAARFPRENRADFLRDFDAIIVKLVQRYVPEFQDYHTLWDGPPRWQVLPNREDVEHWGLYTMLNPVSSGIAKTVSEFDSYTSLHDSISSHVRTFQVLDRHEYNRRRRYNRNLKKEDFVRTYQLSYARLPGYEELSQKEYFEVMCQKVERRRQEMIADRLAAGKGYADRTALRALKPGATPRSTKKRSRYHIRPLVLTLCAETRRHRLSLYFSIVEAYRKASALFRAGQRLAEFPRGTHLPVIRHRAATA